MAFAPASEEEEEDKVMKKDGKAERMINSARK